MKRFNLTIIGLIAITFATSEKELTETNKELNNLYKKSLEDIGVFQFNIDEVKNEVMKVTTDIDLDHLKRVFLNEYYKHGEMFQDFSNELQVHFYGTEVTTSTSKWIDSIVPNLQQETNQKVIWFILTQVFKTKDINILNALN